MATTGNATASGSAGTAQKTPLVWRIVVGIVVVVAVLIVLAMVIYLFGAVYGQEFSPATFTRRDYVYYQIPLMGIQITPVFRSMGTNDLETHLTVNRLVTKSTAKNPRWDTVVVHSLGAPLGEPGDAYLLCAYLDASDGENDLVWLNWTKKHPKLAKTLWPAVAAAARDRQYVLIPDMIESAMQVGTPDELQRQLDRIVAEVEPQ